MKRHSECPKWGGVSTRKCGHVHTRAREEQEVVRKGVEQQMEQNTADQGWEPTFSFAFIGVRHSLDSSDILLLLTVVNQDIMMV